VEFVDALHAQLKDRVGMLRAKLETLEFLSQAYQGLQFKNCLSLAICQFQEIFHN